MTVFAHAEPIHEEDVQVAGDEGAAAESHDRHAGRHAAAIGKPLHQRADRRDVAEAAADAADDAHAEEDQDRLAQRQADAADDQAACRRRAPRRSRPRAGRAARPTARRTPRSGRAAPAPS